MSCWDRSWGRRHVNRVHQMRNVQNFMMRYPLTMQNTGTSLLETFDAKQIRVHVDLIRAAAVTQKAQQPPPANPEDACKVRS